MSFGKVAKYRMDNPKDRKRHQDYQAEYQKVQDQVNKRRELSANADAVKIKNKQNK